MLLGFTESVDAMMTALWILFSGEEELMRVRYVSPLCGLTFRWMGSVFWLVFCLVGFVLFVWGVAVCWFVCVFFCLVAVVFVLVLFHPSLPSYKRYEAHVGLSEMGTRPCSGDTMSLVRFVVVSLSVLDCLYPRAPPQPVRKKQAN